MKNSLFATLLALLVLVACGKNQQPTPTPVLPSAKDTLTWKQTTLLFATPKNSPNPKAQLSLDYPKFSSAPTLNKQIANLLSDGTTKNLQEYGESFLNDWYNFEKSFPNTPQQWEITRTATVKRNDTELVLIKIDDYLYTGGAHPISLTRYYSFNPVNYTQLDYTEIFNQGYQQKLTKLVQQKFYQTRNIPKGQSLEDAGFTMFTDGFKLPHYFAPTPDSLYFYYNVYEAAPYAMGPTGFALPWNAVKHLVKPRYLPANVTE